MLTVKNLTLGLHQKGKYLPAVEDVSFSVGKGEIVGIIGESGSGKSITAKAIASILPQSIKQLNGTISFNEIRLDQLSKKKWKAIYGKKMGFIFQNPMTALNPVVRVGKQLMFAYKAHHTDDIKAVKQKALDTLRHVGIPEAERVFNSYPHELSGGLKQRVMIAIAIINQPELLIADEPTTALDATVKKQILDLFLKLRKEDGLSILFISHDISAVSYLCDQILVLYGGQALEQGDRESVLKKPNHPYTQALLKAVPRIKSPQKLVGIPGTVPSLIEEKKGCIFAPRCAYKQETCLEKKPVRELLDKGHSFSCFYPLQQVNQGEKGHGKAVSRQEVTKA